jgi:outer membrane protein assembly factor BamB
VTVAEGRLFTMGNDNNQDTIFCLDARTGEMLWTHTYREKRAPKFYEGGPSATPTVDGPQVFTFSKSGVVHCLDVESGEVVWTVDLADALELKPPMWGFAGSPLVRDDLLILNAGSAGVALKKATGELAWRSGQGPPGYSTPLPVEHGGRPMILMMSKESLVAVQPEDGDLLWEAPWKTKSDVNAADPLVVDANRYFITSGYNHGCSLVQVQGDVPRTEWENRNMRSQFNSPVLWQGHVYGVDDKRLVCLDVSTGELMWAEAAIGRASLLIADGKLILLNERGELHVAEPSPDGFRVLSRAQVLGGKCWSAPVLAHGLIYCRNSKGDLVCLDVRPK